MCSCTCKFISIEGEIRSGGGGGGLPIILDAKWRPLREGAMGNITFRESLNPFLNCCRFAAHSPTIQCMSHPPYCPPPKMNKKET